MMERSVRQPHGHTVATARVDGGAIFIESLVAAAIVAMILATTFRVITDSAARERESEQRRMALLVAQSELAAVGYELPLEVGENDGVSGNLAWSVNVTPFSDESGASSAGALSKVVVSVRPRSGGRTLVALETLRLGPER
jgi:type II secretory pathway pseudopilin PulG